MDGPDTGVPSRSMDVLPETPPARRTRKPRAIGDAAPELPVSGRAPAELATPPAAETPAPSEAPATPAVYPPSQQAAAAAATPAAAPAVAPPAVAPPAVAPAAPTLATQTPATPTPAAQTPATQTPAAQTPQEPPASPPEAAPPAAVTPAAPPVPSTTTPDDGGAGVRALQEAFAIDIAEREDRHRAEVRAMQQSFMADVNAREDRHRAEVQALHQRATADNAARDERHRNEIGELQQSLDNTRAQLSDASAARDRETEARIAADAEVQRLRKELESHRGEIGRLNTQTDDLTVSLAESRQQTDKWTAQAQRLEADLAKARADAEKAAAVAARQLDAKTSQLDDTSRQLAETTRRLETSEERAARLVETAAAHEAAAQQLRQTVAEQRSERERITEERDEARQRTIELEAQVRTIEFDAEQAADEAARKLNEATELIQAAEERSARVGGQSAVHEATIDELRQALSEQQVEAREAKADRDSAQRRAAELEAEVARLQRKLETVVRDDKPADPAAAVTDDKPVAATEPSAEPSADVTDGSASTDLVDDRPLSLAEEIEIVPWQREALAAWAAKGHRGVIEAVSGTDKTPVAYWAIAEALDQRMKVLVVTPTAERVDQWYDGLRSALPINRVGKITARHGAADVIVCTIQDAVHESAFGTSFEGLIVADQVHLYGTREHSPALDPLFTWRLGLTATYERDDNGISTYLDPYFGGVSMRLGYEQALESAVIAPFDIAVVSVRLTNAEQAEYDALGNQIKDLAATLVAEFGVPPTDRFTEAVTTLAGGRLGPARNAARSYQKALAKRNELVAGASGKSPVLKALAARVRDGERALVFAQDEPSASHVTKLFAAESCSTRALTGIELGRRARRGDSGRDGDDICLVAAPRGADENVNLSDVDLAIVIGASGGSRQVMHRLGQVIRPKSDDRHSRLVAVYVHGTDEDDYSDDASAIATITPYAASSRELTGAESGALVEFLNPAAG
ncbi:MAG TPA: DEAD/DEAH box helicase family protein [Mycobacteriales bacterium]|nr:DEAD/DEAH box helicase family protein [Mycobacteriales bacterium]